MAHNINNPLQVAIFALHHAKSHENLSPDVLQMILVAEKEIAQGWPRSVCGTSSEVITERCGYNE
jgi:hypothetical protein